MQLFENLTSDEKIVLYRYAARAGWCCCIFLAGLLGRIAVAWIIKVNGAVSRLDRLETKCEERHKRRK